MLRWKRGVYYLRFLGILTVVKVGAQGKPLIKCTNRIIIQSEHYSSFLIKLRLKNVWFSIFIKTWCLQKILEQIAPISTFLEYLLRLSVSVKHFNYTNLNFQKCHFCIHLHLKSVWQTLIQVSHISTWFKNDKNFQIPLFQNYLIYIISLTGFAVLYSFLSSNQLITKLPYLFLVRF